MTQTTDWPQTRSFPPFDPTPEQRQGVAFAQPRPRELPHALSQEQLNHFWNTGYVILPDLFTPDEAAEFQREAARLYADPLAVPQNQRYDFTSPSQPDNTAVLWKIDPFHDLSRTFMAMVRDRRICDALASIYGGREPRLFKDKLIYKPPHTHGNGLHQDYLWWQGYPVSLISVCIAIDEATRENGCTVVYPDLYRKGLMTTPGSFKDFPADQVDRSQAVFNLAKPGDVIMFHCFTPHEAGPNRTDHPRRQIFLTYNDSADGEFHQAHYEHFHWYVSRKYSEERKAQLFYR